MTSRPAKDLACRECSTPWPDPKAAFPRTCLVCDGTVWRNLLPVGVLVIPARNRPDEFIVVRRAIGTVLENELALAGGFMEAPKTRITDEAVAILVWKSEIAREALEEIQLVVDPATIKLLDVVSAPTQPGNLLVFASCPPQDVPEDFVPNDEISEVVVVHASEIDRLPWSTHRAAVHAYIKQQRDAAELAALRALRVEVVKALRRGEITPGFFEDELRALAALDAA